MGKKFRHWHCLSTLGQRPKDIPDLVDTIFKNREFQRVEKLEYGDWGLNAALETISAAIRNRKRIALYADYDVDGTMSCVSWMWFLQALNYDNVIYHIPDRFKEGYGVNLAAVQSLVRDKGAQVIITMDTGITANAEAAWCKANGVDFICTDHHKIQPERMPDCVILNPKLHPDPAYQELCGAGITFVLLRRLAKTFPIPDEVWTDILALTGMATICDVVPLNGVNHKLAQLGVSALTRSRRPILQKLLKSSAVQIGSMDERDVGFKLGPRINAVGRLDHAHLVIRAFLEDDGAELISHMDHLNEKRKNIQKHIVDEAHRLAIDYSDEPLLFLGGDWHQGVVGIAASKIAEEHWRPTFLFQRGATLCKGSARTIPGFDVTEAMMSCSDLFEKFGGHKAAGGFAFLPENEPLIRNRLNSWAQNLRQTNPQMWESKIEFDCELDSSLLRLELLDELAALRPFGHQFSEPLFCVDGKVEAVQFYKDQSTGKPKHTAVSIATGARKPQKVVFFNAVYEEFEHAQSARFLLNIARNEWQGQTSLSLIGRDFDIPTP